MSYPSAEDVRVKVEVDPSLVADYNARQRDVVDDARRGLLRTCGR